jgi:type I restriction enzyme S subunit
MPERKKGVVPRLRFPEFRDAGPWEVKRLGEVVEVLDNMRKPVTSTARNPGPYPYYGASGIIDYIDEYIFDERLVLIGEDGAKWGPFESTAFIAEGKYWVNNHAHVLRALAVSDVLLVNYLNATDVSIYVTGAAPPKLTLDNLKLIRIPIPPIEDEQQKIADCLLSLDELITLQAQKLDALNAHKKGLMQQLFPREGETTPRLRFPEFRDAGPWEVKRLGEVVEVLDNMRKPVTSTARNPGPYPYYGASGIIDYIDEYIFDERLVLIGEDGAKWGPFESTAFIAEGKYWVNNHAHVLRALAVSDVLLVNYLNATDVSIYVTGAAPPKLTLDNLKLIRIPIPPIEDEQQKIADCLLSLDELITLQAQKLDALNAHKKGLMQQLFPQEVE